VAAWPLAARAQRSTANVPVVTLINARKANTATALVAEFRKDLGEAGLTEGKDVVVEYHWLDGRYEEEVVAILNDAISRHVAVIAMPANTAGSLAAKAATSTIPIVFGVSEDPVALGLVASLARPGGNVTGINFFDAEIDAKRLGLMHEIVPKAKRFAVLINPASAKPAGATAQALREAAPGLGIELLFFKASSAFEIDAAFAAIVDAKAEAVFVVPNGYFASRKRSSITPPAPIRSRRRMTPFNLGAMLAAEKCAFLFEPVADYVNTAIGAGCRGTCISIIFNAG
jgi:putative ABC transport system substrate-binding protein